MPGGGGVWPKPQVKVCFVSRVITDDKPQPRLIFSSPYLRQVLYLTALAILDLLPHLAGLTHLKYPLTFKLQALRNPLQGWSRSQKEEARITQRVGALKASLL